MSNIYMKIAEIEGSATAEGYKKAIVLHSVNFSFSRHITSQVGRVSDREASSPRVSEVTITKSLDRASNTLMEQMLAGKSIPSVEIYVCTTDSTPQHYVRYVLKDVMISHHEHGVSANSQPVEILDLNYTQIQITQTLRDEKNNALSPNASGYDLKTASVL
jgi:type VI secretion system secreted protein Hcp